MSDASHLHDLVDDLRRALREACDIAERLDDRRQFTGRIAGWRDVADPARKPAKAPTCRFCGRGIGFGHTMCGPCSDVP